MTAEAATLTLAEFVARRLDEDEAVARAATAGPWRYDPMKVNSIDRQESVFAGEMGLRATTVASTGPEDDRQSMADAAHIARHDPARVLAEVAAKREILRRCGGVGALMPSEHLAHGVLAHLAAIYSDHPDYREDWRP